MTLRRFFIFALLTGVLAALSAGSIYLYNFDLNSFRAEIESLASERIDRPLTLGNAHLSLKHGPAFAFDRVKIGTTDDNLSLDVNRVYLRLQTLPLLSGEIRFSEILLEQPEFRVRLGKQEETTPPLRIDSGSSLLTGELIQSLRILNGSILITDSGNDEEPEPIIIEGLRFSIDDFSFLHAGNIRAKATLVHGGVRSPFSMQGEYRPNEDTTSWDGAYYRFDLSLQHLSANSLMQWLGQTKTGVELQGHADLGILVQGSPQSGLAFETKLLGDTLELQPAAADTPPVLIRQVNLAGQLSYADQAVDFETIRFELDTSHGRLNIDNQTRLRLTDRTVAVVTSSGNITTRFNADNEQLPHPFFSRNLDSSYQLQLDRAASGWNLSEGRLSMPGIDLNLHGQWNRDKEQSSLLILDIPETTLASVTALLPGLEHLGLSGRFDTRLSIKARPGEALQTRGRLHLAGVHLTLPGNLADLNNLSGTIQIDNASLTARELTAELGQSPIRVDFDLPDLSTPEMSLHVRSAAIRADELIFSSDRLLLKQVDGIVRIADNTVFLGPIHVKMDGGTDATVHGTVRNFAAADVALQIQGRHGNIDEIIALWEQNQTSPPPPAHTARGSLNIDIKTASGQISGMQFNQATAKIVRRDKTLVIGPIHFKAKSGEGVGQVLMTRQDNGSSLLRISGNLKNFNALTVYQQLLKRKGLVTGRLNGDFYLEGTVGKQFLPTSFGVFSVQIEDGRLNKLTGLGKILQILNLYPMLTENVQGKGLPYDRMTFNATLDKGILSTEDFLMKGSIMNLSLVGNYNLNNNSLDFKLGAMPLRSVDSILSRIPIAGWLLTGSKKALLIAHFEMTGNAADPEVRSIPVESLTEPVIGIFKRVFSLPVEILTDPGKVIINQ